MPGEVITWDLSYRKAAPLPVLTESLDHVSWGYGHQLDFAQRAKLRRLTRLQEEYSTTTSGTARYHVEELMRPFADYAKHFDTHDTDCLGNVTYGRKAAAGNLPGKGGDTHSVIRSTSKKRRTRTLWNKRARCVLARDTVARCED